VDINFQIFVLRYSHLVLRVGRRGFPLVCDLNSTFLHCATLSYIPFKVIKMEKALVPVLTKERSPMLLDSSRLLSLKN